MEYTLLKKQMHKMYLNSRLRFPSLSDAGLILIADSILESLDNSYLFSSLYEPFLYNPSSLL